MKAITHFRGEHAFLSNFYPSEIVTWRGDSCTTVEHAFQAEKMHSSEDYHTVLRASTPAAAKRYARSRPMHPDWENIKLDVMGYYVRQKFTRHAHLAHLLLATGTAKLIEGNTWGDIYWGAEWRIDQWYGQNHLGKILMEVRSELSVQCYSRGA